MSSLSTLKEVKQQVLFRIASVMKLLSSQRLELFLACHDVREGEANQCSMVPSQEGGQKKNGNRKSCTQSVTNACSCSDGFSACRLPNNRKRKVLIPPSSSVCFPPWKKSRCVTLRSTIVYISRSSIQSRCSFSWVCSVTGNVAYDSMYVGTAEVKDAHDLAAIAGISGTFNFP